MRVAYVSMPWSRVIPPVEQADSIAAWTYEVARRVAREADVTIYARTVAGRPRVESHGGVSYRRVPLLDGLGRSLRERLRPETQGQQDFRARSFYTPFIAQVALSCLRHAPDLVHVQQFLQYPPVIKTAARRTRTVLHMHAEWLTQMDPGRVERGLRYVDAVFGCSGHIVEQIRQRFPTMASRCHVVANGVDPATVAPERPVPQAERGGPPRMVFVGRISPEKAVHVLLRAFPEIAARVPDVELELIGPPAVTPRDYIVGVSSDPRVLALAGWYEGDYVERLRELVPPRLRHRVHFTGEVKRSALREHYARAHLLVNPSVSESFGMALVEALAAGIPVVASRIGGMPEIVEHGKTGLIVEPDDPAALADAAVRLLENPSLRQNMAEAGRADVLTRFSWDAVAARAASLYREIVAA